MSDRRGCTRTLAVALLLVGGGLLAVIVSKTALVFDAQSWPTAEGVVESSGRDAGGMPAATCRFTVGGRVHRGTVLHLRGQGTGVEPPPEGETVAVHYDPGQPDRCALHVGDLRVELALCAVPFVMFIIPGLFLFRAGGRLPVAPPAAAVAPMPGCAPASPELRSGWSRAGSAEVACASGSGTRGGPSGSSRGGAGSRGGWPAGSPSSSWSSCSFAARPPG